MTPTDDEIGAELAALFAQVDVDLPCTPALIAVIDGSASAEERAAVEAHAEGCAPCRARLDDVDTAPLLPVQRRRSRPWGIIGGVLAAAASLALFFAVRDVDPDPVVLTAKSGWRLHVGVERGARRFRLMEGTRVAEGDRIGLFYDAAAPGFATVFYVDDRGEVTPLLTGERAQGHPVSPGQSQSLPGGAELGEAEGCEFVVGIYAPEPLADGRARAIVEEMATGARDCRLGPAPDVADGVFIDSRTVEW